MLPYLVALVGCLVNSLAAPYTYAVQATSITRWNIIRLVQPITYLVAMILLRLIDRLSLLSLSWALVLSTGVALAYAYMTCRTLRLTGGTARSSLVRVLVRYGLAEASAGVPLTLNQNLDKVMLAGLVGASDLGRYAVAMSVVSIAAPFATAISSVFFPRLARERGQSEGARNLARRSVQAVVALSLPLTVLLALVGPWAIPAVFGAEFAGAGVLLWWLAPATFFRSISTVLAGLLRGAGRPALIARSQAMGVAVSFSSMPVLVHFLEVPGAGVALGLGELVCLASSSLAMRTVHRTKHLQHQTTRHRLHAS